MVREMKKEDITDCARILCAVYNNEKWQCRWNLGKAFAYLEDYFAAGKFVGYVAESDHVICGSIFCHEKVWWNNNEVFIDEMFVHPDFQRKGYGTMLIGAVEEYVKEKKLAGFTLLTNRYSDAPKFYHKNGFEDGEHVLSMYKIVEE